MQESNLQAVCTATGSLVDKADTLGIALSQRIGNTILNLEGYVVNALAAIVQELLNGALGACGLQQLNLDLTNLQEGGLYLLILYYLLLVELKAQNVCVVRQYVSNALNSNAEDLLYGS